MRIMHFENDRQFNVYHLKCRMKYRILRVILLLFILLSIYFLLTEGEENHSRGFTAAELTEIETAKDNVMQFRYVNKSGETTYAIDKHYAILVQIKNSEGDLAEEYYLDENGEPTSCSGYFGISYKYREKKKIITYLDAKGNPTETVAGYTIVVRSFNDIDQAMDDMYYDDTMKPVKCVDGYYGFRREYDQDGHVEGIIYLDSNGIPTYNSSGYVEEKYCLDKEGRVGKKFYFDASGKAIQLQLGQSGEAYSYDEDNRITQITYLDSSGNPITTTAGYSILRKNYYRDGTENTTMYYNTDGKQISFSKHQYGIKHVGNTSLYLNKNGGIKICLDNILNGYPFMVVIIGILLCMALCLVPQKWKGIILLTYVVFIFYETLMFREIGDIRANLVLFSYADIFLTNWKVRVEVINNIWLFVPFGAGLYAIYRKKRVWITAFILSVLIEVIQYFTGLGIAELDDIFGNTLGGIIGVGFGSVIFYEIGKWKRISKKILI